MASSDLSDDATYNDKEADVSFNIDQLVVPLERELESNAQRLDRQEKEADKMSEAGPSLQELCAPAHLAAHHGH